MPSVHRRLSRVCQVLGATSTQLWEAELWFQKLMGYQGVSQGTMSRTLRHLWANWVSKAHVEEEQLRLRPYGRFCRTKSPQLDRVALQTALEEKL